MPMRSIWQCTAQTDYYLHSKWMDTGFSSIKADQSPPMIPSLTFERELLRCFAAAATVSVQRLRHLGQQGESGWRTALAVLDNAAEAEDALQTAFMQILLHAASYRCGGGGERPWFDRILINTCRIQCRHRNSMRDSKNHQSPGVTQAALAHSSGSGRCGSSRYVFGTLTASASRQPRSQQPGRD
jgi:hypothetical protein